LLKWGGYGEKRGKNIRAAKAKVEYSKFFEGKSAQIKKF
jgi:hypothetical protein